MIANLTASMDGLAGLVTGQAPTVYAYPVDSITVPCIVVGYPTDITLDVTYQRGGDQMLIPLWYIVGKTTTKDARDALSTIIGDASSVKSSIDGAQSFGDCRVTDAKIEEVTVNAIAYIAVRFDVEII